MKAETALAEKLRTAGMDTHAIRLQQVADQILKRERCRVPQAIPGLEKAVKADVGMLLSLLGISGETIRRHVDMYLTERAKQLGDESGRDCSASKNATYTLPGSSPSSKHDERGPNVGAPTGPSKIAPHVVPPSSKSDEPSRQHSAPKSTDPIMPGSSPPIRVARGPHVAAPTGPTAAAPRDAVPPVRPAPKHPNPWVRKAEKEIVKQTVHDTFKLLDGRSIGDVEAREVPRLIAEAEKTAERGKQASIVWYVLRQVRSYAANPQPGQMIRTYVPEVVMQSAISQAQGRSNAI